MRPRSSGIPGNASAPAATQRAALTGIWWWFSPSRQRCAPLDALVQVALVALAVLGGNRKVAGTVPENARRKPAAGAPGGQHQPNWTDRFVNAPSNQNPVIGKVVTGRSSATAPDATRTGA